MYLRTALKKSAEKYGPTPIKIQLRSPNRDVGTAINGNTLIFADMPHLTSVEHWQLVLTHIEQDIINYLSKGITLQPDKIQFAIVGNSMKKSTTYPRIDEAKQNIKLYYNNNTSEDIAPPKKPGLRFLKDDFTPCEKAIKNHTDKLTKLIITLLLRATIGPAEYLQITDENIQHGYVSILMNRAKEAIDTISLDLSSKIASSVIEKINALSKDEKLKRFYHQAPVQIAQDKNEAMELTVQI